MSMMSVRDLIPWGRGSTTPTTIRDSDRHPFLSLHREVNRLFDDMFRGFDARWSGMGIGWPNVEVAETDADIRVTAEVPGLSEKDVEVLWQDGVLILRGERRAENEDAARQFSERFYGRFERRVPIDAEVQEDKVEATFRNGVLTVRLPKTPQAQSKVKRIPIQA